MSSNQAVPKLNAIEREYLKTQPLGRLATAGADGKPHVVPVAFRFNPELGTIDIGGFRFGQRKKFRDVRSNPWAAFVVDDVVSPDPWTVRMIEIRGRAAALEHGGAELHEGFAEEMIRISIDHVVSYGLSETPA
jgi:pyridoxamine 5'-phosphate oxidase family protein